MKNLKSNCLQSALIISLIMVFVSCSKKEDTVHGFTSTKPGAVPFVTTFISDINADTLSTYTTWLQNMQPRFMLSANRRNIAVSIKNKFIQLGLSNTVLDSFYITNYYKDTTYNTWQYNVIATITGSLYPDSLFIVGAHYDAILNVPGNPWIASPGADDNGSGVASLLEIGRVIKKRNFVPKSSIQLIAFGAEELNMDGSNDYTTKAMLGSKKIKWMLNNDMISFENHPNQPDWKVNIMDYANSAALRVSAENYVSMYTDLGKAHDTTANKEGDSYNFYLKGYKALFFISSASTPYYHQMQDVVGNCNFPYCREVTKVSCAMLVDQNR
ncbi:MAG: M20/M25/M40 family metallo-hydrolase [Bacteroidetes bacterium]|nr:M20/M25/M40 family metallo-hydrolase [Bacteroidota bacterium]